MPVTTQELLRAVAFLTALEYRTDAEAAAAAVPDWFEVVDVLRAVDGCQNLARALDQQRRRPPAARPPE